VDWVKATFAGRRRDEVRRRRKYEGRFTNDVI
jgi:hypothetical protein